MFSECNLNKMILKSANAVNYESNAKKKKLKLIGQKVWELHFFFYILCI